MVEGKAITILPAEAALFGVDDAHEREFVMVKISDDGCGIDADLLTKVTEPFFTTKEAGDGSGLGLSSVAGFVKQSGGGLRIASELGLGTTVKLLLPLAQPLQQNVLEVLSSTPFRERSNGKPQATILVVDDEPRIRQVAARWLEREGYTVVQAQDAESALEEIENLDGKIDVLFSDIIMPGKLDGRDLANVVSRTFPNVAIQLTTGYEHERHHHPQDRKHADFPVISKPYDLQELSASVRRLVLKRLERV
jgi:CheY-like chemotaxis protein